MEQLELFSESSMGLVVKNQEISHKAETYTGLYALHKYWGKKPYNIISDFIKKYSKASEIVLDPFCGSGVAITEAVFNKRKAIGVDVNPAAIFITEQLLYNFNPNLIKAEFRKIELDIKDRINKCYTVIRDAEYFTGQNYLWEGGKLTEVRYSSPGRRRFYSSRPAESDLDLANSFNRSQITTFYPTDVLFSNARINAKPSQSVSDLFTDRNLFALSILFDRINKIVNEDIKKIFHFCFTSSIGQASKMVFVIKRRNKTKLADIDTVGEKKEVGSWVIGYWQPEDFFENNVWNCFENRYLKLLKAKTEQFNLKHKYSKAGNCNELELSKDYLLVNEPSQRFLKTISPNSIDYIITDPPHGNRIPYLELSMLWNAWLQNNVEYKEEIIVSESRERNKTAADYNELLSSVITQCYRILKPERSFSFMFNSLDDDAWINVISAFHKAGFKLSVIETMGYSANSVVQDNRKNGLQTDFILTYTKPKNTKARHKLQIVDLKDYPDTGEQINELTTIGYKPFQILNKVISTFLEKDKFIKISQILDSINHD